MAGYPRLIHHHFQSSGIMLLVLVFACLTLPVFAASEIRNCPPKCKCGNVLNEWTEVFELTIDCSDKGLGEVPDFVGNQKIDRLILHTNFIHKIRSREFAGIKPRIIDLRDNQISALDSIAFQGVEDTVEELMLGGNDISTLPLTSLTILSKLKSLDLEASVGLRQLPKASFQNLEHLEKLNLDRCRIEIVDDEAFLSVENSLKHLSFYGNYLTSVPIALQKLRVLEKLNLDTNEISQIAAHAFKGMSKLKIIHLNKNEFSNIAGINELAFIDLADTLQELEFFHCDLTKYPQKAIGYLHKLRRLSLDTNDISSFSDGAFSSLDSLETLILDYNPFTLRSEMFHGIQDTLRMLSLRGLRLSSLPANELNDLRKLKWIDASSNDFRSLSENLTIGIHAHKYVFNWMQITNISTEAFPNKGTILSIHENRLQNLDFVQEPCLFAEIEISKNPLHCDCHVFYISMHRDIKLKGTCKSPPKLVGLEIGSQKFRRKMFEECKHLNITHRVDCSPEYRIYHNSNNIYYNGSDSASGLIAGSSTWLCVFFTLVSSCWLQILRNSVI